MARPIWLVPPRWVEPMATTCADAAAAPSASAAAVTAAARPVRVRIICRLPVVRTAGGRSSLDGAGPPRSRGRRTGRERFDLRHGRLMLPTKAVRTNYRPRPPGQGAAGRKPADGREEGTEPDEPTARTSPRASHR